eukprot:SAG11_NODE_3968_length_2129_cov_1.133498_2_plen_192_part_00
MSTTLHRGEKQCIGRLSATQSVLKTCPRCRSSSQLASVGFGSEERRLVGDFVAHRTAPGTKFPLCHVSLLLRLVRSSPSMCRLPRNAQCGHGRSSVISTSSWQPERRIGSPMRVAGESAVFTPLPLKPVPRSRAACSAAMLEATLAHYGVVLQPDGELLPQGGDALGGDGDCLPIFCPHISVELKRSDVLV